MKIITIEGLDKAGKHTQTVKLQKALESKGYYVMSESFTKYDNETGKMLMGYLKGSVKFDNFTNQLLLLSNKQEQQHHLKELEEDGVDFLILDRYLQSQFIYALYFIIKDYKAKRITEDQMVSQITIINEFTSHQAIPSDLNIYIDVTPEISVNRKGKYGDNDIYEKNLDLHRNVRALYKFFAGNRKDTEEVSGVNAPLEVSDDVWSVVKGYLDGFKNFLPDPKDLLETYLEFEGADLDDLDLDDRNFCGQLRDVLVNNRQKFSNIKKNKSNGIKIY